MENEELCALKYAQSIQTKASQLGFDFSDHSEIIGKVIEEVDECIDALTENKNALRMEVGDLLFSCVNLARFLGFDASDALELSSEKYSERMKTLQAILKEEGKTFKDYNSEALFELWDKVKIKELEAT